MLRFTLSGILARSRSFARFLLGSNTRQLVDIGGNSGGLDFAVLNQGLREFRNLPIVHLPLRDLPRSIKFGLFLVTMKQHGSIMSVMVDSEMVIVTHREWILAQVDRFGAIEAIFATC